MRRETQNVLLVLLGGALLKIAWNGSYLRYVKPSLLPFLVAAGVVILALGLISIVRDVRAARDHIDHGDHPDHAGRSSWLLLLPVLAIFLVAPRRWARTPCHGPRRWPRNGPPSTSRRCPPDRLPRCG